MAIMRTIVFTSALVWGCLMTSDSSAHCDGNSCDASLEAFVDGDLQYLEPESAEDVSIHLLQKNAAYTGLFQKGTTQGKCRRRCRYHPKHDCRLICRISCVKGRPVENQKCKEGDATTTTTTSTTTSGEFNEEHEPTEEQTCHMSSTFSTQFNNLVENTIGEDVDNPRMVYKDVVELSDMLKNQGEWKTRKFDLTITDASQLPKYQNNPQGNFVANPFGQNNEKHVTKYVRDKKNYTGTYLETVRINFDQAGSYVFRFTLTDSETGEPAPLPLFPLTFYDIDGAGEAVGTCDALRVIKVNSKLADHKDDSGCFAHKSRESNKAGREVNLPKNFEQLTATQKAHSITYVYANKAQWDVQIHLDKSTPQRYFVMKSSKVLACSNEVDLDQGDWKERFKGSPKKKKKGDH